MAYENAAGMPREKVKYLAYILVVECGSRQSDVAKALRCSQPTIALWVKEVKYQVQINRLNAELSAVRSEAKVIAGRLNSLALK